MLRIALLLSALTFGAFPLFAAGACNPAYTGDQCLQMVDDADEEDEEPGGGPGPSGCPYYMCGNAYPMAQAAEGWCEARQAWINCPVAYCQYSPCSGFNCYVTSMTCSDCPSLPGNNGRGSTCPRM